MGALMLTAFVWHSLFGSGAQPRDFSGEWICTWSADRYTAMMHLTDEADFRFLRLQPGFKAEMEMRVREQRYRMFLVYLCRLKCDFTGIAFALKRLLANADQDRAKLASTLLHAQLAFSWAFVTASARAYAWRKGLGSVDTGKLLVVLDRVHTELRSLAPSPGAA
jgi:hypothetical protein